MIRADSDNMGRAARLRNPRAAVWAAGMLCAWLLVSALSPALAADKQVIGWIEKVLVSTEAVIMEAKVDTGADFSSVHADDVQSLERDGRTWIRFTLSDSSGGRRTLERPVERTARIKKKAGGFQQRQVVRLQLCVGGTWRAAVVNIAQRGHFRYPLLLGRDFLRGHYLVDAGERYLSAPACR